MPVFTGLCFELRHLGIFKSDIFPSGSADIVLIIIARPGLGRCACEYFAIAMKERPFLPSFLLSTFSNPSIRPH
jgi:hypothetical protein